MKVVVYQDKDLSNYNEFCLIMDKAQKNIGKISHILYCGENKGSDVLCQQYARDNNLKISSYKANWSDIKCSGAKIKERTNLWSKKIEKYNSHAGFQRNEKMVNDAKAVVILDITIPGATNIVKLAQDNETKIYINYKEEEILTEDNIQF